MKFQFLLTPQYSQSLEEIENFIFESTNKIEQIEKFLDDHDKILKFIEHNPNTPAVHPITGDKSWIFGEGRYRIFFIPVENTSNQITIIHLIDIIALLSGLIFRI